MEPLALAQLFVLPAVLAAGWALVAARWGGDAAALAGLLRGGDLLAGRADLLPAGALVLLIGNARLRYVPGPSEAAWEGWLLLLGPVLLLLAPWLWALIARRGAVRLGAVAAGILAVIGVALAMSAYIYEGAAADQSGPSWDYGSIGGS
jgi:hypothetical protein